MFSCDDVQLENNLEREKRLRADVEKNKRKLESDLRSTQDTVEELEKLKRQLEETVRKLFAVYFVSGQFRYRLSEIKILSCNRLTPQGRGISFRPSLFLLCDPPLAGRPLAA